jgi:cytochrome c1
MPAHDPAEMPVWGTEFAENERLNKAQVEQRVKNLTNYIKSLQKE